MLPVSTRRGRPRSPNFDRARVSCGVTSFGCLSSAIAHVRPTKLKSSYSETVTVLGSTPPA